MVRTKKSHNSKIQLTNGNFYTQKFYRRLSCKKNSRRAFNSVWFSLVFQFNFFSFFFIGSVRFIQFSISFSVFVLWFFLSTETYTCVLKRRLRACFEVVYHTKKISILRLYEMVKSWRSFQLRVFHSYRFKYLALT